LCVLWEQPAHPYQIVQTLEARHKVAVAKLNYGSLYTVIARLERDGTIEAVEVTRSGNLPPRTTYKVTASGAAELTDWLAAIIGEPMVEPNSSAAALST
jgi:DNA-binding PadR family transcriptional regulator